MLSWSRLSLVIVALVISALACNAGSNEPAVPPRERTQVPTMLPTTNTPSPATETPSATPIPPLPTDAPPATQAATVPPPPPNRQPPAPTSPPAQVSSPTPATYPPLVATWRMVDAGPGERGQAIMTIEIYAQGGDGNYSYYWDGQYVNGPRFQIRYLQGAVFTTTISVRSGDGQEVSWMLWEWVAWFATPMGGEQKNCPVWYPGITKDESVCP